jgi:hypothetical protein
MHPDLVVFPRLTSIVSIIIGLCIAMQMIATTSPSDCGYSSHRRSTTFSILWSDKCFSLISQRETAAERYMLSDARPSGQAGTYNKRDKETSGRADAERVAFVTEVVE